MLKEAKLVGVNTNPIWQDTEGKHIQAHGGGILYHKGKYYWYGENKEAETKFAISPKKGWDIHRVDVIGVSCHSSTDLVDWKNEGVVLPAVSHDVHHDLHVTKVVERPKVLFNEKTKKFVMWAHIDDMEYDAARTGIAVSDSPTGPFNYLGSFKPNGSDSRDMTVFVDDDQKAYLFHSSEGNKTLYITPLSEDYLKPEGQSTRIFVEMSREAPTVFKRKGKYYIITSGCSGSDPNKAEYATADQIEGPWEIKDYPCTGKDAEITFFAQSTFVLKINEKEDQFLFMADLWKKEDLKSSRYIWLPIKFDGDDIEIMWIDKWSVKFQCII